MSHLALVVLLLLAEAAPAPAPAPAKPAAAADVAAGEHHHDAAGGPHDATMRHGFGDVERWVSVFDDPARDAWQKPADVVAALGVRAGDVVADVGAGTGYFEPYLSRAVGSEGTVLAVDVEPSLVAHLRERAEKEGTRNVVPVLASYDDPRLPFGAVDLVLIVDTYHHVDDRLTWLGRVRRALAAGGRVAVVDFVDRERPVGPPPEHSLSRDFVVGEMKQAGYELVGEPDILPWQYVLAFRPADGR